MYAIVKTAAAFLVAALLAAPAAGRVLRATVEVRGMSCPFCAFGVEKRLRKVAGAGGVEVSMNESRATVRAEDGASIDALALPEAVRRAGFTPGPVTVEAEGTVRRDGERWLLVDGEAILRLAVGEEHPELAELLAELARQETPARLRGTLDPAAGDPPLLVAVEPVAER
ncbi:MAG: heavy-metal-associated domain-containing protein [Acidobacteria bacterium]|nr:MAG: heavy-metal-associated domain-containing protein [Acidobacteriota bacterium]